MIIGDYIYIYSRTEHPFVTKIYQKENGLYLREITNYYWNSYCWGEADNPYDDIEFYYEKDDYIYVYIYSSGVLKKIHRSFFNYTNDYLKNITYDKWIDELNRIATSTKIGYKDYFEDAFLQESPFYKLIKDIKYFLSKKLREEYDWLREDFWRFLGMDKFNNLYFINGIYYEMEEKHFQIKKYNSKGELVATIYLEKDDYTKFLLSYEESDLAWLDIGDVGIDKEGNIYQFAQYRTGCKLIKYEKVE
jgi:hypothetical protein